MEISYYRIPENLGGGHSSFFAAQKFRPENFRRRLDERRSPERQTCRAPLGVVALLYRSSWLDAVDVDRSVLRCVARNFDLLSECRVRFHGILVGYVYDGLGLRINEDPA